jgi:hypothetical protein
MKALIIDDLSVSGVGGLALQVALDFTGHVARLIEAPLLYDARSFTSYAPEVFNDIVSGASDFNPDWVVMILQGVDSSQQVDLAIALHEEMPAARFYFSSGYPHPEELDRARSCGLNLRFELMPVNIDKFVADIEQPAP